MRCEKNTYIKESKRREKEHINEEAKRVILVAYGRQSVSGMKKKSELNQKNSIKLGIEIIIHTVYRRDEW